MVPTWLKSLFSRRTNLTKRSNPMRRSRPMARPGLVQLEERAVPAVVSIADATTIEGNAGTSILMFTVSADVAEADDITFKINTSNLTATAGSDYVALVDINGQIDAGNTTTTVMVTINGDTLVELDESFKVTLSNLKAGNTFAGGGATESATGTITNDDQATISISSPSVTEGGTLGFSVTIDNKVDVAVMADRKTADGTATEPGDYTAIANGNVQLFAANSDTAFTINVSTSAETLVELNETLSVILSNLTASGRDVVFSGGGASLAGTGTITNDDQATITISSPSQAESDGMLTFTVSIDNPVDADVTADRKTTDGTALAASDYSALANANITLFAANSGADKSIVVTVSNENLVELEESLSLTLSNLAASGRKVMFAGGGASLAATGMILNDDSATITISNPSVAEGGVFTFDVNIDNPVDAAVTAMRKTADGTATTGNNDYTALADAGLTLFAANSTATKTINVVTTGDSTVEADETISLILSMLDASTRTVSFSGGGATLTGTGTISNNDTTVLTINSRTDNEGAGSVIFTIDSTNKVQGGFTVQYKSTDGTATAGSDYKAIVNDGTNKATFAGTAGEDETFTVTLLNDDIVEADETYILSLFNVVPTNSAIALSAFDITDTGTGTITSGDTAQFRITANASASEGDPITFTITLSNQVQATTSVTVTTSGGTAMNGTDYTDATGMVVTFDPLVTSKTFMVMTTEDNVVEAAETFNFSIGGLNDGGLVGDVTIDGAQDSRVGTINNDDSAKFQITAMASATEGSPVAFMVTLTNPVDVATSVEVKTAEGSAKDPQDYTDINMVVMFPAGTTSKTVMVTTKADNDVEGDETFTISLDNEVTGGRSVTIDGANDSGIGTIIDDDNAILMIDDVSKNEADGSMTFTVTLVGTVEDGFTVDFKAINGTATTGDNDFTLANGTLTFAGTDGETKTIVVTINNDSKVEADETFMVQLFNVDPVDNGTQASAVSVADKGLGTIVNDDSALVSISKTASAIEGNKITFTVSLSNPVDVTTTVKVSTTDITATGGGVDYDTLSDFLVTFNPTVQNQSVMVTTKSENIVETDETFSIAIGSLNDGGRPTVTIDAANATGTGTITNDDMAEFTIGNASIVEGGMITFTINLSNPVSTDTSVTVTTADVNAIDGVDYTGLMAQLVMFPALSTSQQVKVATTVDAIVEADETFKAMLGDLNDGGFPGQVTISPTNGTATGTITNDDSTTLTIDDVTQAEAAGMMKFAVTLGNAVQGGFKVDFKTIDGSAKASDSDFASATGTLTFAGTVGETQFFFVTINDDNRVEADESYTVSLFNVVPLEMGVPAGKIDATDTATGTIQNDDSAAFSIAKSAMAVEGNKVKFTVSLSNPVDVATSVTVTTTDGTAKSVGAPLFDNDFVALSAQTVNFGPDVTSVDVFVTTNADAIVELDEIFSIALGGLNTGGRPTVSIDATADTGTGTIINDDTAQFKINSASVTEGGKVVFTVTLTNPVDVPTSVTVSTADGSALQPGDYSKLDAVTVNFAALDTSETIEVTTNEDDVVEANETFTASLGGLMDGGRTVTIDAGNMTGTGTILNNDLASLSIADVAMNEATGTITFTVLLTGDVQGGFSVDIQTKDGTATTADSDYAAGLKTLIFAGTSGETQQFTVTINDDAKVEADETFTVNLLNVTPNDAKVKAADIGSTDTAIGTILNDDATTLTVADVSQAEGAGKMTFTVTLSNPVQGGLKVDFATADGTALLSDNDYAKSTGTLTFAGTAGETQTFTVTINDDVTIEPNELFNVSLSNVVTLGAGVSAAKVDATDTAVGNILTDDTAVINLFASTDVEGNNLVYTITLSNKISKDVTVDFATLAGVGARPAVSGVDFTAVAKSVTFLAGSTKETIVVPLTDDRRVEGSEQFESQITNIAADASVLTALSFGTSKATATITDNDTITATFTKAANSALEDNIAGVIATVDLAISAVGTGTVGLDRTIVVRVSDTLGGTATNGVDYKNFTNPTDLTFAPADFTKTTQNIAFDIVEDLNKEGDETIVFGISLKSDATAGQASIGAPNTHTYTIGSDDETIRTYDATVTGDYRFVRNGGNVELRLGATLLSSDPIGTQPILLNGTAGVDSATVDYASGSMVPSGGITFNGNGPAAGERLVVSGGSFASILQTHTGAEAGMLVLTGTTTDKLAYVAVDAVEITTASAGDITIQLPASASNALLKSAGIPQITSTNGTFASTSFVNPTGTLTLLTGNGADTLTVADVPDLTSSLFAGTTVARFQSITQTGDFDSKNGQVRYFAGTIAINDGADLTAAGEIELNSTGTVTLGTTSISGSKFTQQGGGNVVITAGDTATITGRNGTEKTLSFAGAINGPGSLVTGVSTGESLFQQPIGQTTGLALVQLGAPVNASSTGSKLVTGGMLGGSLNVTAANIALNADVTATFGPLVLNLQGGNATQKAPFTTSQLFLNGSGNFILDNAKNSLTSVGLNQIANTTKLVGSKMVLDPPAIQALPGELFAKLNSGSIVVRDQTDLVIRLSDPNSTTPAISIAAGGSVTLSTGGDFSLEDPRAIDPTVTDKNIASLTSVIDVTNAGTVQINVGVDRDPVDIGSGQFSFGSTLARVLAENTAGKFTVGQSFEPQIPFANRINVGDLENTAKDTFTVRPMTRAPLFVNGNSPIVADGGKAAPWDSLSPNFTGIIGVGLISQGVGAGTYNFTDPRGFQSLQFTSIETLGGFSAEAFVVQTAPRRDTTNDATGYAIRLRQTVQGPEDPTAVPTGGSIGGSGIITNPFVVTPDRTSSNSVFSAPRIALALIDADTIPDLIVVNGAGDAPLVTVIRGASLSQSNSTLDLSRLTTRRVNPSDQINVIAQFVAFEETFRGGLNVSAGDLDGDGLAEIAVAAGIGGGPRISIFKIVNRASDGILRDGNGKDIGDVDVFNNAAFFTKNGQPFNFFPYESTFRGGVNVALGDVNGDGIADIVAGAGFGGGPRVRVYDGSVVPTSNDNGDNTKAAILADYFAYDATTFRGGVFVDAGRFDGDEIADVVTAPGPGGGPHIQVFLGSAAAPLSKLGISFFAFEPTQSGLLPEQAPGTSGVSSVGFGSSADGSGSRRSILTSQPRGQSFEVVKFEFDNPLDVGTMKRSEDFEEMLNSSLVNGVFIPSNTIEDPTAPGGGISIDALRNGGSVGGFAAG
jgi:hypothetical protein